MNTFLSRPSLLERFGTSSTVATQASLFSSCSSTSTIATSIAEDAGHDPPSAVLKNVITFDGGGVRGIFHILVLFALQGHLDDDCAARNIEPLVLQGVIHECIGTSVGACVPHPLIALILSLSTSSLLAVMFALMKSSPVEMIDLFKRFSRAIFEYRGIVPLGFKRLLWNYAQRQCSSTQLNEALGELMKIAGFDANVPLAAFADCGISVTLVTVDTDDADEAVLLSNEDTSSTWTVRDAVRASAAAPLLFKPVTHEGRTYVDGGFKANNPSPYVRTPVHETNLLLSIGTGARKIALPKKTSFAGIGRLARALGQKVTSPRDADRETRRLFEAAGRIDRYIRIEPPAEAIDGLHIHDWRRVPEFMEKCTVYLQTPDVAAELRHAARLIVENAHHPC